MRIKTFYTKTMAEALRQVKAHLGPDALLLSTKEIPRRSGIWGTSSGFEVVAAVDDTEEIDMFSPSYETESAAVSSERDADELMLPQSLAPGLRNMQPPSEEPELQTYSPARLKKQADLSAKIARAKKISASPRFDPPIEVPISSGQELPFKGRVPVSLYQDLVNCGVDAALACELLKGAWGCLTAGQRRSRQAVMKSITQAALALVADPSTLNGMPAKKVVAVIGPTGVGKTTSIAKLAARLALQQKKKVLLMTTDGYRIGAVEQLRSYAGLMGIPFRFVDQVAQLPQAISENAQRDYILIDTAGRGPRDLGQMDRLASFLSESEFIERHLVLSAATKQSDMREMMDRFEICHPDHLLFTKLDETSTPGPILNELVRTQKSFSYYSNGQRVPDDLHAVPRDRIIDIVLNPNMSAIKE
jgi:flagellar biosynthesis protein FlhF